MDASKDTQYVLNMHLDTENKVTTQNDCINDVRPPLVYQKPYLKKYGYTNRVKKYFKPVFGRLQFWLTVALTVWLLTLVLQTIGFLPQP